MTYIADIAWAAGFFDGEGCITIHLSRRSSRELRQFHQLRTDVVQKSIAPLQKLIEMFGGGIYQRSSGALYTWVLTGADAEAFLTAILPYLIVKREQALVAVGFRPAFSNRRGVPVTDELWQSREAMRLQLQEMKRS